MANSAWSPDIRARRAPFVAATARGVRRACGSGAVDSLVVGLSGGGDSTALLAALVILARRRRPLLGDLHAVHVHHHLRDADADADATAARDLADRLGVPFTLRHVHPARATGNRADAARRLRYAALTDVARDLGAPWIVTAHHADDQLETMLLALARGSGAAGLAGIADCRALGDDVTLIRPLLDVTHRDCLAFCALAALPYRDDPSNHDPTAARGRLRRDVTPVLESMFPGAASRAARTARSLRTPAPAPAAAGPGRTWSRAELAELDVESIGRALRHAARGLVPADRLSRRLVGPVAECIVRTSDRRPRTFHWPGQVTVRVTARSVAIVSGESNE